jgi:hypothetical protein
MHAAVHHSRKHQHGNYYLYDNAVQFVNISQKVRIRFYLNNFNIPKIHDAMSHLKRLSACSNKYVQDLYSSKQNFLVVPQKRGSKMYICGLTFPQGSVQK